MGATAPSDRKSPELREIVPEDSNQSYDMKEIISRVVDHGEFMEVHQGFAQNLIVAFARMEGKTVGIVAQQPAVDNGCG